MAVFLCTWNVIDGHSGKPRRIIESLPSAPLLLECYLAGGMNFKPHTNPGDVLVMKLAATSHRKSQKTKDCQRFRDEYQRFSQHGAACCVCEEVFACWQVEISVQGKNQHEIDRIIAEVYAYHRKEIDRLKQALAA